MGAVCPCCVYLRVNFDLVYSFDVVTVSLALRFQIPAENGGAYEIILMRLLLVMKKAIELICVVRFSTSVSSESFVVENLCRLFFILLIYTYTVEIVYFLRIG